MRQQSSRSLCAGSASKSYVIFELLMVGRGAEATLEFVLTPPLPMVPTYLPGNSLSVMS